MCTYMETGEMQSPQLPGWLGREEHAPGQQYPSTRKSTFTKGECNEHPLRAHILPSLRTHRPYTSGHVRANHVPSQRCHQKSPRPSLRGHPNQRGSNNNKSFEMRTLKNTVPPY